MLHFSEIEGCEYNSRYGSELYAFEQEGSPLTKKLLSEWSGTHDDSHDNFYVACYYDSKTYRYVVAPQAESNVREFDYAFETKAYYKRLVGLLIDKEFGSSLGEPSNEECYKKALADCDIFFAASREYKVEGLAE